MIRERQGQAALAICDECGCEADSVEARSERTGALLWAALPEGWTNRPDAVGDVHRCGGCSAQIEGARACA